MKNRIITSEKLAKYQSMGYWKGMTLDMCRDYEAKGYWPGVTLHDYFYHTASEFSDRKFIVHPDRSISYGEACEMIKRLTAGLLELGIKKADVVCALLHNCPEMAFLQIALSQIGAVIQPIHLVYREHEIKKRVEFCKANALVIPGEIKGFDYVEMVEDFLEDLRLEHVFVVGSHKKIVGSMRPLESVYEIKSAKAVEEVLLRSEPDANDILLLNFTSGTETEPKGFLHTHNTILGNTYIGATKICNFTPGREVLLTFSPMTHTFGHMITYFAAMTGATIVMVDTYDPGKTLELIEEHKISFIQGTPAHFLRFLDHPDFSKYDLDSLRILATGGSAIPPALSHRLKQETGAELTVWFGMGEDIIHTAVYPGEKDDVFVETVGGPVPGAELAIFDEQRNKLGPGEIGEIGFRGAAMFLGYFENPEKTRSTRSNEGWFFTADTGLVGEDGYLRLRGRKKDMINRGGSKIFPLTVENALSFHPKIHSICVVGIPDPDLGERVCACIIPVEGETLTRDEIAAYMRERGFSRYEIPERVEIVTEFPMTPTGKVKKDLLQQRIIS